MSNGLANKQTKNIQVLLRDKKDLKFQNSLIWHRNNEMT